MRVVQSRAVIVALVLALTAALPTVAGAQSDDPPEQGPADWVPFRGTYAVGCTRASADNPGCPVHHPTWAIDFATPTDTRIRATGYGIVIGVHRGCAPDGADGECNGGAGNIVVVDHGDYWSRYLHLSEIPDRIRDGRRVEPGDVIGRSGASGTFGAAHLHYDEYQAGPPAGRVAFGPMLACHDDEAVVYPDVLGYSRWDLVPPGSLIRNDNHDCTGHPQLPHPPPPEPPVYPEGAPLGVGGSPAVAAGDLDGDGDIDLAIGAPGGRPVQARTGLVAMVDPTDRSEQETLAQGDALLGLRESGDRVGASVAVGDFDCDGLDDVAIGAPGEDLDEVFVDAGAVNVRYGDGDQQLIFSGSVIPSYYRRPHDWLGAALAVGDFGNDGCDDLAIASPGADRSGGLDMGLVWVLRGSSNGLHRPQRLLQGVSFGGVLENRDQTGYALAAGDFDCDGRDDLAAGVPREVIDGEMAGAVMVAYGRRSGFRRAHAIFRGGGLPGEPVDGELLGISLAAGDVDGDGCEDLAIGAPEATVGTRNNAGLAVVVFGHGDGLDDSGRTAELTWAGLPGGPRKGDRAGSAVAIADVDCDGYGDVVVGVPGRDIKDTRNVGAVFVAHGSVDGVGRADHVVRQGKGLKGRLHARARVGEGVTGADLDGDGCDELIVSAPGTTVRGEYRAGAVLVRWGSERKRRPDPLRFDQRTVHAGDPTLRGAFGGSSPLQLLDRALD